MDYDVAGMFTELSDEMSWSGIGEFGSGVCVFGVAAGLSSWLAMLAGRGVCREMCGGKKRWTAQMAWPLAVER